LNKVVSTTEPAGRRKKVAAPSQTSLLGHGRLTPYLFAGPSILLVAAVLAFPVGYSIYRSFFSPEEFGGPEHFVGFRNYAEALSKPTFWDSLGRTGIFVLGCVVLGQLLAISFAFILNRAVRRLRFLRALTIVPWIVSSVAVAFLFRMVFNGEFGAVNQILEFFGVAGLQWLLNPWLAMVVVIVAQLWSDLPLSVLLILGGLQTVDQSYLDAARVDGATGWRRTRHITLPLIAPQLAISTVWLSYTCLTSFGVILSLTGGGPGTATQTLPMEIYSLAFRRLDYNGALVVVTILLVLNAVFTLFYTKLASRYEVD
jgi:multiple sugar transport system permease protein